jgi:anion-transporting  ArsA/GET3 family ATPase
MGEIKSALEIAMEKVNQMEEPTEEEKLQWKYTPEGEKLAGRYLKEKVNLLSELNNYNEEVRKYIINGATGILARNISLPMNDHIKQNNKKAMDGLKIIKKDKVAVENLFSKIRYIFNHYEEQGEQQKKQAYESLKADLGEKIQQALQQQMSPMMGANIDVEKQPQFQQEWRKIQQQIDGQYISHLNEYIRELIDIP